MFQRALAQLKRQNLEDFWENARRACCWRQRRPSVSNRILRVGTCFYPHTCHGPFVGEPVSGPLLRG